jgi:phosphoribosylformimino-5-aminoimidazole carboxamide ribotide isomerase
MLIIPAIDLKDGRCVRLQQGRMDTATVFSEDPVAMARHWSGQGARRLHYRRPERRHSPGGRKTKR